MSRQHSHVTDWPEVETLSPEEKRVAVAALPAPEPGQVVTVPLMLLPTYLQRHRREPLQYRHPLLLIKHEEPA